MKKTVIKLGLIGGSIVTLVMLVTMPFFDSNSDMVMGEVVGYTSMMVAFSTIFIGVRSYRNSHLNGTITFGQGFQVGLYITLIASTMYVICWLLLSEFVVTDFSEIYLNNTIEKLNSSDLSQAEIDTQITQVKSQMEMYENPIFKILVTYLEILPVGLLFSLVAAVIFKKK